MHVSLKSGNSHVKFKKLMKLKTNIKYTMAKWKNKSLTFDKN